jgi:hypothetical protein
MVKKAGQVEIFCDGKWILLNEREVAVFSLNEVYNMRTGSQVKEITYPHSTNNIAAVTIVYKWIPPLFEIQNDEMNFIIQNDWFSDQFDQNNKDPQASHVFRLEETLQKKFWNIVERNKSIKI